jgi:hypothetical protein
VFVPTCTYTAQVGDLCNKRLVNYFSIYVHILMQFLIVYFCKRAYGSGSQCRPNECIFGSGKPRGVRNSGRGLYEPDEGNGEVSLRAVGTRGTDPVTARRVPSKLRRVKQESKRGNQQREKMARGMYRVHMTLFRLVCIVACLQCLNDTSCTYA